MRHKPGVRQRADELTCGRRPRWCRGTEFYRQEIQPDKERWRFRAPRGGREPGAKTANESRRNAEEDRAWPRLRKDSSQRKIRRQVPGQAFRRGSSRLIITGNLRCCGQVTPVDTERRFRLTWF